MRAFARAVPLSLGIIFLLTPIAYAQVSVELDEVIDNRVSAGPFVGNLELRLKLNGSGLDKASGARVVVKEAKDDKGTVLTPSGDLPDFTPRDYNSGMLNLSLKSPPRAASSVRVKGNVEMYVPSRDPNAIVKVEKALSKYDTPLSAKALKAAKINITPISREKYVAQMKAQKIDDEKIAKIKEEGKKQGVDEKEIEAMIELAKAFQGLNTEPSEGAVLLSGKEADFDRIFRIEILGSDGKPIDINSRSTSTSGEDSLMTLNPSSPPPPDAVLQLFLITDKSRVTAPFDLKVSLP